MPLVVNQQAAGTAAGRKMGGVFQPSPYAVSMVLSTDEVPPPVWREWVQQRLACSIRELLDPANAARPITDIALASGFSNLSHVSRVFRAHTGGSPSDFRRQAAGR